MDQLIGQTIADKYIIQEQIGSGGTGNVYRAHDTVLLRDVAIKLLRSEIHSVTQFIQEARLIAGLEHHYILPVYDFGTHVIDRENRPYLVLQLAASGSLTKLLKQQNLNIEDTLQIFRQICEAIHYAHQQRVIHLDIKPANILLSQQNTALVSDFGISRILGTENYLQTRNITGTPPYMAPEQLTQGKIGIFSDIFALGILLYELRMHRVPDERAFPLDPPDIGDVTPIILGDIITKATAPNPEDRYSSIMEMLVAVTEVFGQSADDLHHQSTVTVTQSDEPISPAFKEETRRLDAAIPRKTVVNRTTEVRVQLCLPNSPGFRNDLPTVTKSGDVITRKDVRTGTLGVSFPINPKTNKPKPVRLRVHLRAAEFVVDEDFQDIQIKPEQDSGLVVFTLTPRFTRKSSPVHITVKQTLDDGATITLGAVALTTEIISTGAGPVIQNAAEILWSIVSLPLAAIATTATGILEEQSDDDIDTLVLDSKLDSPDDTDRTENDPMSDSLTSESQLPESAPDSLPDFDNMSPEDLMIWMETLAKRQGANAEELLTAADADIAEVDANTAVVNEPGYFPFGSPPPAAQPVTTEQQPIAPEPKLDSEPVDLSALSGLSGIETGEAGEEPMQWLESLESGTTEEPESDEFAPEPDTDSFNTVNPDEWLHDLAGFRFNTDIDTALDGILNDPSTSTEVPEPEDYSEPEEPIMSPMPQLDEPESNDPRETVAISSHDWLDNVSGYEPEEHEEADDLDLDDVTIDSDEESPLGDVAAWLGDVADDPAVQEHMPQPDPTHPIDEDRYGGVASGYVQPDDMDQWLEDELSDGGSDASPLPSVPPLPADIIQDIENSGGGAPETLSTMEIPAWVDEDVPNPDTEDSVLVPEWLEFEDEPPFEVGAGSEIIEEDSPSPDIETQAEIDEIDIPDEELEAEETSPPLTEMPEWLTEPVVDPNAGEDPIEPEPIEAAAEDDLVEPEPIVEQYDDLFDDDDEPVLDGELDAPTPVLEIPAWLLEESPHADSIDDIIAEALTEQRRVVTTGRLAGHYRSEQLDHVLRALHAVVDGVNASVVVNIDGLLVASYPPGDEEEDFHNNPTSSPQVAALSGTVISLAQRTLRRLAQGDLQRLLIEGKDGVVVVYPAGRAALAVLVAKDARLAHILFTTKQAAREVRHILE